MDLQIRKIVFVIVLVLTLAGCGRRNIECRDYLEEPGVTTTRVVRGYLRGHDVVDRVTTITFEFRTYEAARTIYEIIKDEDEDFEYRLSDTKVVAERVETLSPPKTREEFISEARRDGLICE